MTYRSTGRSSWSVDSSLLAEAGAVAMSSAAAAATASLVVVKVEAEDLLVIPTVFHGLLEVCMPTVRRTRASKGIVTHCACVDARCVLGQTRRRRWAAAFGTRRRRKRWLLHEGKRCWRGPRSKTGPCYHTYLSTQVLTKPWR